MSAKVPQDPAKGKLYVDRLIEAVTPELSTALDRMLEEFRATLEAEANVGLKKALLDKEAEFRARTAEEDDRLREKTAQMEAEGTVRLKKALLDKEAEFRARATEEEGRVREKVAQMEAEANIRQKKAVLDKEAEFRARATDDDRRIREETGQTVRGEVVAELEARFKEQLAGELDGLRRTLQKDAADTLERWKQEKLDLTAEANRWRLVADFHRRVGDAASQTEILKSFLAAAEHFSDGVAVYLNKPDGLALWHAVGETAFPDMVSEVTRDPDWFFAPIVVQSKTIAAVCATGLTDPDAFGTTTDALKRAIENFGLRIRFFGRGGVSEPDVVERAVERTVERAVVQPGPDGSDDPDVGADARRLARMLVSEIKLGYEKQVLEGRTHSDLYSRLQREIDDGRETYRRQVQEADPDYFYEELVKILADNDPEKLGQGYPGTGGR